jgi:rubrerythrin
MPTFHADQEAQMSMPTNPPPSFGSAEELMAMAHAMEKEAARRYRDLAIGMRVRHWEELAQLFDFLESLEEKHAVQLERRAPGSCDAVVTAERVAWDLPENFDEEAGTSFLLTPYRALALAVRNEERAFVFYCHVAAEAPDYPIRHIAEGLAKDELTHAWLLRRERRRAFRAEADKHRATANLLPGSIEEFFGLAAQTDWQAAHYHHSLAGSLQAADRLKEAFERVAEDEADCARESAQRGGLALSEPGPKGAPTFAGGMRLLEEAFERYSDIADRSKQEDVLQAAQQLAARAVQRLAYVGGTESNRLLDRPVPARERRP